MKIEDEVEAMKRKLFKEVDEREVERLRKEMKK